METDNHPSDLRQIATLLTVIALAVILALRIDFKDSATTTPTDNKPDTGAVTADANQPATWKEGKSLFKSNCAACHNPKSDGTGPALIGVTNKWKEKGGDYKGKTAEQWLKLWIKNWNEPVDAGYKYAIEMANSRGPVMNSFTYLKDTDIDKILEYVNNPDGKQPAFKEAKL